MELKGVNNNEQQLKALNVAYHNCLQQESAKFLENPTSFRLPAGTLEFCENEKSEVYKFMRLNF